MERVGQWYGGGGLHCAADQNVFTFCKISNNIKILLALHELCHDGSSTRQVCS